MNKMDDYRNMGKAYFNRLENKMGLHFGVADRFLIRSLTKGNSCRVDLSERSRQIYNCLEFFGYESVELSDRLEKRREYQKKSVKEWERQYRNSKNS